LTAAAPKMVKYNLWSICVAEWVRSRAVIFTAHEFDGSPVQTPGADTVNQAVHPTRVGKLVALSSIQWVTAAEHR
jgi:hypothetical protein